MKYLFLIMTNVGISTFFCHTDSSIKRKSYVYMELGTSSSMFFENYTGNRFNKNEGTTLGISFIKLGYSRGLFSGFVNFKSYYETNPTGTTKYNQKFVDPGFIQSRSYSILDVGLSYSCYLKKIKLRIEPSLLLSYRLSGNEVVCIIPNIYHLPGYYTAYYNYKSHGVGLALNFRKHIFKELYIGFETQFNHFYESKKGAYENGFQEFDKNYKINKDILTLILKLGYQINLRRKK